MNGHVIDWQCWEVVPIQFAFCSYQSMKGLDFRFQFLKVRGANVVGNLHPINDRFVQSPLCCELHAIDHPGQWGPPVPVEPNGGSHDPAVSNPRSCTTQKRAPQSSPWERPKATLLEPKNPRDLEVKGSCEIWIMLTC